MKDKEIIRIHKVFIKEAERVGLSYHTVAIGVALCGSIALYLIINAALLPESLPIPATSAINWLTVHKYSLMLDYIRFAILVIVIPSVTFIGWLLFIWQKTRT